MWIFDRSPGLTVRVECRVRGSSHIQVNVLSVVLLESPSNGPLEKSHVSRRKERSNDRRW